MTTRGMEQWEPSRHAWIVPRLSPASFRCSRSIARNHRQCTTRHTDPLLLLVADIDFPDLGRAPDMQRDRRRGQKPLTDGTEMVGIDFLPKGDHASRTVQKRAGGGSRLSECNASPAMQVAPRLQMLCGHWHRHHDTFRGRLDDLHL